MTIYTISGKNCTKKAQTESKCQQRLGVHAGLKKESELNMGRTRKWPSRKRENQEGGMPRISTGKQGILGSRHGPERLLFIHYATRRKVDFQRCSFRTVYFPFLFLLLFLFLFIASLCLFFRRCFSPSPCTLASSHSGRPPLLPPPPARRGVNQFCKYCFRTNYEPKTGLVEMLAEPHELCRLFGLAPSLSGTAVATSFLLFRILAFRLGVLRKRERRRNSRGAPCLLRGPH